MSHRYAVMTGKVASEDDPNDEAKIPQHAADLRTEIYPLALRQKILEQLANVRKILDCYQQGLILVNQDNIDTIRQKLAIIRSAINRKKLTISCEFKNCPNDRSQIPIYLNLCKTCLNPDSIDKLHLDLMTLRNLILRVQFLEEQISSSLSNQLNESELASAVKESKDLYSIVS